jgi:hypothetical protein
MSFILGVDDITVIKNEEEMILTDRPSIIYTFGAGQTAPAKTVTIDNRMHIWINSAFDPAWNGDTFATAREEMSSTWIIISYNGVMAKGGIKAGGSRAGTEGRTWSALSTVGPAKVTVTVLEADRARAFLYFLALRIRNDIQRFYIRNDRLQLTTNIWRNCIEPILDADWERRQDAAGVVDLTGYKPLHSMLESLHHRLLSLENKI